MPSEPQSNRDAHLLQGGSVPSKNGVDQSGDVSNYVEACITVAKAVRWLTFALSICSGSLFLLIAIFYHGNLSYVLERRKEIQKQCFNQPPTNETNETQCKNFITDTWNSELRDAPQASSPTILEPYDFAKQSNQARYKAASELDGQMKVIELPLVNIKLLTTDFAIILVLLSLFFLYWLRLNLEFARNALCSLYNDAFAASQVARTVPTHFVLFWPGGSRRRSHWAFWAVIYSVVASGLILILTDVYDFFWTGPRHSVSLSMQAGWGIYSYYAYGKIAIELLMMAVAAYVIYNLRSIVRDVRNLLLLVEWAPKALHPLLYRLFDKKEEKEKKEEPARLKAGEDGFEESQLLKGANESSYDEYVPGLFCLRIRLTFPKEAKETNADEPYDEHRFYARIDLWRSASNESSFSRVKRKRLYSDDEEWAHTLAEERRMRRFFYNILTNPHIERELCHEFWKVAKKRNVQGEWMKRCEKEFSKERNKSYATTTEIVSRIEDYDE